jgi:hypothetical protein
MESGVHAAIAIKEERAVTFVYMTGSGVRARRRPLEEMKHAQPLLENVHDSARTMRKFGKDRGMTKAAREALRGL